MCFKYETKAKLREPKYQHINSLFRPALEDDPLRNKLEQLNFLSKNIKAWQPRTKGFYPHPYSHLRER